MFSLTGIQRYGGAVLAVMLTGALRIALGSILTQDLPLFLFILPMTLACTSGGLGPGLVATGLSLLFGNSPDLTRELSLGFSGTVFSILFDRARKAIKAIIERPAVCCKTSSMPCQVGFPSTMCGRRRIVFINRAVADTLGSVSSQELPEPGFIRSVMHPDDWQPFLDHVKRFSAFGDGETGEFEFRCLTMATPGAGFMLATRCFAATKTAACGRSSAQQPTLRNVRMRKTTPGS